MKKKFKSDGLIVGKTYVIRCYCATYRIKVGRIDSKDGAICHCEYQCYSDTKRQYFPAKNDVMKWGSFTMESLEWIRPSKFQFK